jgi:murein DD-endopeptidase MepM/ murein hydrolase activator NlpD
MNARHDGKVEARSRFGAAVGLVLFALVASPQLGAAAICQTGKFEQPPLELDMPIALDDARVIAGYGIQTHPFLQVPRFHLGVDWGAPQGTPVLAVGSGQVLVAGAHAQYGNRVVIDHGGGWQTIYGHLASFVVQPGDCIAAGTVIGSVGDTGLVRVPAIHFEVRCEDDTVDPMSMRTSPNNKAPPVSCAGLS